MGHRTIDIILPVFNHPDETLRCINALDNMTSNFMLFWIDNGSTQENKLWIKNALEAREIPFVLQEFSENRGFPIAVNAGINLSNSDPFIILNNDVQVSAGWLVKLLSYMDKHLEIGILGTLQDASRVNHYEKFYGVLKNPMTFINAQPTRTRRILQSCVPFSCVGVRRAVVKKIGLLDEDFSPGLGEDDDYCDRARLAGFATEFLLNCFIHHEGHKTINELPGLEALKKRNKALYLQKMKRRRGL
jgi:GT2 family glycosyltransferase